MPEYEIMPQRGFYPDFRDNVESFRQGRGVATARWDDVLVVAAETPQTAKVLREQGVYPYQLSQDIRFSLSFSRPGAYSFSPIHLTAAGLHNEAAGELLRDIADYLDVQNTQGDPEGNRLGKTLMRQLRRYMRCREDLLADPDASFRERKKVELANLSINGFLAQMGFTSETIGGGPSNLPSPQAARAKLDTLASFAEYIQLKSAVILDGTQPLVILDSENKQQLATGGLTPFQLIERAKELADPFLLYALYRNGLAAPVDYEPPFRMPHAVVTTHAMEAFNYVKHQRENVVSYKHLLPSLLDNPEVHAIIKELDQDNKISEKDDPDEGSAFILMFGSRSRTGRNYIKFNAAVKRAISPDDNSGEKFYHHPVISEDLKEFLYNATDIVAKGPDELAEARLLGELLKVAEVQAVLIKAGLTKAQLAKWPAALKKVQKKLAEDQKVGDKKKEPFKIDDKELEQLLEQYSVDKTKLALAGKLKPVIGREQELRTMVQILLQRDRSNPLLLGEPGVGKSALFDGLAQIIAAGRVPKELIGARVLSLDLSSMTGGAMYRGQFEGRILPIVKGIAERNARGDKPPIILCIDELHAAMNAGSAENTPGAGELLKPYLASGELYIVGATTQKDYARVIEPDHALVRRFQSIFVGEPSLEEIGKILEGLAPVYVGHHRIEIPKELFPLIVDLTRRYLPTDMQPDKSVSTLDEACTRARIAGKTILDKDSVIDAVAAKAKIDHEFLKTSEGRKFLRLRDRLPHRVLGQSEATTGISAALIAAKAGLRNPKYPLGRFLLLGPTGVGKTETARTIAMLLFGTEDALIRIDMTDYKEAHKTSRMVGSTPGYVGYGEEGDLTGRVRRRPHSVLLLDEVEKADPDVMDILMPILEEGQLTDGRSQVTNFRNTIILMTSNVGSTEASRQLMGFGGKRQDIEAQEAQIRATFERELKRFFKPEFLNRLDGWYVYHSLTRDVIRRLVRREVHTVSSRLQDRWGLPLSVSKPALDDLVATGYRPEFGARELTRTVQNRLAQPLATWLLSQNGKLPSFGIIKVDSLEPDFSATIV